jgi:hypothetical protein
MSKKRSVRGFQIASEEAIPPVVLVPDNTHPDYVAGIVSDPSDKVTDLTPAADDTQLRAFAVSEPLLPFPIPQPKPAAPLPFPRFCSAVSGRYRHVVRGDPRWPLFPRHALVTVTVRVDVDRYFPQNRISIEVNRLFPASSAHAIAEVTSDTCRSFNNRRIEAVITYRDGNAALIPCDRVVFEALRAAGLNYGTYRLTLAGAGTTSRTYNLNFESPYFDCVEFEVDRVENAGSAVTTYATSAHPNRPVTLPDETISLQTVYQRAGFEATMSPNVSTLPLSGAGSNGTWSDAEMHNAMVSYWSRFQNKPQWAMWLLYAAQHDVGYSLGGVMFDDIGPNHRQGTAVFTDSFIQEVPAGDSNPAAWRRRMIFWTAVHEMGHAFNLAHSWQKALGTPQGAPGDPWIPLANEPEARSFMNYPFRVPGGQATFFSDFHFRFSDDELVFMRHAPRRFVQMGHSNWFENHGFEAPEALLAPTTWKLEIRANRQINNYRFLEPVNVELKLTNTSANSQELEADMLSDARHVTIFVARHGGTTHQWRPFVSRCQQVHMDTLKPNHSIYGAFLISASTMGWLIDEPGFYKVQAALDMGDDIVVSNVLRLHVSPPTSTEEIRVAPDYFSEEVGRAIAFHGVPAYEQAINTLCEVELCCSDNPAAYHATMALSLPLLRHFKLLDDFDGDPSSMVIRTQEAKVDEGARRLTEALVENPEPAAETIGHIDYFATVNQLVHAMEESGDEKGAINVLETSIDTMKKRRILASVIQAADEQLERSKLAFS